MTPGAEFAVTVKGHFVEVRVWMPVPLELTAEQAAALEGNLHNAVELALAPVYPEGVKVG
jgi:hypothetical protein